MSMHVNLPPGEMVKLQAALRYYRFESVNHFFRAACRALIDQYQDRDPILTPLKFSAAREFNETSPRPGEL